MSIQQISDTNFVKETKEGLVLVDFWAPWCGPCRMLGPTLEEVSQELGSKIKIVKVNVDENPETSAHFGIMSIPTMLVMKDGQVVDQMVGARPKANILNRLQNHLA
jgi:thioredoxin 1